MYENGKVIVLYPSIIGLEHTHTHTKGLSTQIFCRDKHTFVATKHVFCHYKSMLAVTKYRIKIKQLSAQKLCRDKHTFIATKHVFCRDKNVFVATKESLLRQATKVLSQQHVFVATNLCGDKNDTYDSSPE